MKLITDYSKDELQKELNELQIQYNDSGSTKRRRPKQSCTAN